MMNREQCGRKQTVTYVKVLELSRLFLRLKKETRKLSVGWFMDAIRDNVNTKRYRCAN
jgi:hypothetical protein